MKIASAIAMILLASAACVPQIQRQHLADPTMQLADESLEGQMSRKYHGTREGANGGDGQAAGGGCGCAN